MSAIIGTGAQAISQSNIFGGFAPFPNSIMIPFMGYQSAVLAYDFGINYETGKRTVKSIPSDLFNRIRSGDDTPINVVYNGVESTIPTHQYFDFLRQQHMQKMLTNFRNELPQSQSVMNDIIEFSVEIEKKKAERTPSAWAEIIQAFGGATQDEVVTWLDSLPETERQFLLTLSPLLALMYTTSKAGIIQPIPIGDPQPEITLDTYTSFTFTYDDPALGTTESYTTSSLTWYGHDQAILENANTYPSSPTWGNWRNAYRAKLNETYNISSA